MPAFPNIRLPLRIRALEEAFIIDDAAGRLLDAFYFDEGDEIRRQVRKRVTREEAQAAVKAAAPAVTALVEADRRETRSLLSSTASNP